MFKIGAEPIPSALAIENGVPKGVVGEVFIKINNLIPNTTWVAVERQENPLNYFAMDIDYPIMTVTLPYLNENVTSGPVLGTDYCFLLSKRNKNTERVSSRFTSVFDDINTNALIAMFAINMILLMMLIIVSSKKNISKALDHFIGLFLRQNCPSINAKTMASTKMVIISCSIFFFLTQSITLGYLQTEFVTVDNEIKIDTFKDVMIYQRKMYAQNRGACLEKYTLSKVSDIPLLPYEVPGEMESPSEPGILRSDVVVLTSTTKYFREYGCSFNYKEDSRLVTADEMYYFSKNPVTSVLRQVFFRKTSKIVRKIISSFYNRCELGLTPSSETFALMIFRSIFGKSQDPSCTQNALSKDHNINPLKIRYFTELMHIYLIVVALACIGFIVEQYFC